MERKQKVGYAQEKIDEEVTADAVGMVFNDQKLAEDLARELEGKPNLLSRIREIWQKIIEQLKSFGTKEELEQAENSLAAFEAVVNSFKSAKEKAIERGLTSYMDAAEASVDDGNGIDLNMRTEKDVQEKLRKDLARLMRQKKSKIKWSKEQIDSVINESESLINLIHSALEGDIRYDQWAKKEPTLRMDWRDGKEKPIVTWSRKNIEYTYDASADLLCINNEGIEATLASPDMVELMLMMGKSPKGFTSEDYMRLYEVMRDLGLNVPCKGCFDAAARLKMLPSVSQNFVDAVNATIDERNKNPEAFDEALRESVRGKNKKGDKTINGLPGKASTKADAIRVGVAGDNLTEHITWTQLMSAEGQSKALSDWGGIFRAWQKTGAGRPKDKLLPEPYNGTYTEQSYTIIAPITEKTPAYDAIRVNVGTGLRRNSHSEFRPILAIDEIQSVRDAYMKGLCMFKYMKELDDVRLFGKMGIKFNMSHFPAFDKNSPVAGLDANGNYISSEESVGSREFTFTDKEGKQHFDGKKGLEEAKKYINEDVSLSSVVFSVPHLIKCFTDVPTHKDLRGIWGSLIPFHSSGATTSQLAHQGLGIARANGVGHNFVDEAYTDYGKGVTNFEDVQNDRFGGGWTILEGAKAGQDVEEGHKLEFANGTHYYNAERGIHLFNTWYVFDNELSEEERAILSNGCKSIESAKDRTRFKNKLKKSVGHPFAIDYNEKAKEIGGDYAYKEAADYYVDLLPKLGLIPRFDFNVPEEAFLRMCADAKVDPHHPKIGWKGEGHGWSPMDSDAYYSLWCDFGMTDPKTGKYSPHRPVGYKEADGTLSFKLPENTVDIVKDGVNRYSEQRDLEERMHNEVMKEYVKRTIADGKLTKEQGETFLKEHIGKNVDYSKRETEEIIAKAKADGTYMKAPNGKPSNLSQRQWAQVRTKAFKNWFGDWEKAARIEKLRESVPVEITGEEITPSDDLKEYKKNALEYGKSLRGSYTNEDTGEVIDLTGGNKRGGIREILQHDYKDSEHLQSIAAIPQIIEKSVFIDELPNEDKQHYPDVKSFRYYVCGLKIGGTDYTVKAVVAEQNNGTRYYDHRLTDIEKGKLLSIVPTIQKAGIDGTLPNSAYKDKRLFSILQTNSSKVVDENGEPRVVYHQTNSTMWVNLETGENFDKLDWKEKDYWKHEASDEERENTWEEQDFYEFDNKSHGRRSIEMPAFFFAPKYDEYHEYGDRTIEAFLNIKNPAINPHIENAGVYDDSGEKAMQKLIEEGYDGFIREYDGIIWEINAFYPNQIKSATENIGTFDTNNNDIRYRVSEELNNGKATDTQSDEKLADSNHLQQMTNYAHDVAEALNVKGDVEVVTSEGLKGKKKQAKGWYDPKTGKITIVADNHTNAADIEQTMLHEAVAHKGLRALFGERFTTFLDNVFTNADAEVRQGITDLMSKNNWDARTATEEYLANLAEATNFEEAKRNGVWDKIKDFFRELLDAVGLSGFSGKLTDNELRYIIWSSYENLKNGDTSREMLAQAKNIAKQKELGVGQFAKEEVNCYCHDLLVVYLW